MSTARNNHRAPWDRSDHVRRPDGMNALVVFEVSPSSTKRYGDSSAFAASFIRWGEMFGGHPHLECIGTFL